ncbi:MAG: PilN domain-containing protein [Gammaproteobacteria bacterium]
MTQINLLPWREQARSAKKLRFLMLFAVFLVATILLIIILHLIMNGLISRQLSINTYLQNRLDQEKTVTANLNTKKLEMGLREFQLGMAYHIQNQSFNTVSLLNVLATNVPDGVNLTKVEKANNQITLEGLAQSNLEVTAFMKNLENTGKFNQPVLTNILDVEANKEHNIEAAKLFQIELVQKE